MGIFMNNQTDINDVSFEEYQLVLQRLEEVKQEKAYATRVYDNNFSMEEKFSSDKIMNIIIILNRRNQWGIDQIKLLKDKFLNRHFFVKKDDDSLMKQLDFELYSETEDETQERKFSKLCGFSELKREVLALQDEIERNNLLLDTIRILLDEEKTLLRKKKIFERKNKKRLLFRKKNDTLRG